ncbi:MAG: hypothetical protein FWG85_07620 [Bacteroidetes bacterium]|nr:hypothetical protein [Bacteroidota bacterium]
MFNFSLKLVLIALAIGLMFAACGGNKQQENAETTPENTEQVDNNGTTLKDLNDNNWQAVIKDNFGIDIAIPSGWKFESVNSPNGVNNLVLLFSIGEGTTGADECKRLFEATKALSPHGNYKNNPNWEAETVSAGDVINDFSSLEGLYSDGDVITSWSFTLDSKMIMVLFSATSTRAEYTFTINNR